MRIRKQKTLRSELREFRWQDREPPNGEMIGKRNPQIRKESAKHRLNRTCEGGIDTSQRWQQSKRRR
ncbi:hypothetical protein V6N12_063491 [Hibiscus sabdariffa]|uniref:Uncharacterized protein n=1 Tax=Hibiscus sabdariffa TaxID=183260 RepID=A0ABR2FC19_9ROSI